MKIFTVATGKARVEGREPSQDGEYLTVIYDQKERFIAENNSGVDFTSEGDDPRSDAVEGDETYQIWDEIQEVISKKGGRTISRADLRRWNGAELKNIAKTWNWI